MARTGRPSKYKPEFGPMLVDHLSKGFTINSFGGVINTCADTVYRWLLENKDFSESRRQGEAARAHFLEDLSIRGMTGEAKGFNPTAFIWHSRNVMGWRDKQDIEISGKDGGPIKTIAMNINADAQSLTDGELRNAVLKAIANKQEDTHDQIERTAPSRISD